MEQMHSMINVGIIGLGFGTQVILPALRRNQRFNVISVAGSGHRTRSKNFSLIGDGVKVTSVRDILSTKQIQAVVVAVPPIAQEGLIVQSILAGKNVLCEKPFTASRNQAMRVCKFAHRKKLLLAVDYEFRYDALLTLCHSAISNGCLGTVRAVKVCWFSGGSLRNDRLWSWRDDIRYSGGVLTEWCSHIIDYVPRLCDSQFKSISCKLRTDVESRLDLEGRSVPVTSPDGCTLQASLCNGVKVSVDVSTARDVRHGHYIDIRGSRGSLKARMTPPYTLSSLSYSITTENNEATNYLAPTGEGEDSIDTRLEAVASLSADFASAIDSSVKAQSLPICQDAIVAWEVMLAARMSSEKDGEEVAINPDILSTSSS